MTESDPKTESADSGTCTSCGERVLLADWPDHRERVHGSRPERVILPEEST
jgi:ribosomal protein S27AE